jgi:uncharacterized protein
MLRFFALTLAFAFATFVPLLAQTKAGDRVALVIGMGSYQSIPALENTRNDAEALARTLEGIGFDVTVMLDAPREQVLRDVEEFAFRAETADLALIYFAGHGVSVQGETYLIPVDAQVSVAPDIVTEAVNLEILQAAVQRARRMSVLILDSCRDNPFPDLVDLRDPEVAKGQTTGDGGLAPPATERGTLIAYAARDGSVALDGDGDNSPFNNALRKFMVVEDLEIAMVFRKVRDDVLISTGKQQEPATYGSLPGEPFYLAGGNSGVEVEGVAELALAWSKIAAENGDALQEMVDAGDTRSMTGMALAKLERDSADYDPDTALALLKKAAEAGDPDAMYRLAKVYEGGFGVPSDPQAALALFQAAAAANVPAAVNDLGFFHYNGEYGLPKDSAKALELFVLAAQLGHSEARFNVASFAANGLAPGLGPKDAADLLYRALRAGSSLSLNGLLQHADRFPVETWKELQKKLAENGFYDGAVDGQMGPGTKEAILAAYGEAEE